MLLCLPFTIFATPTSYNLSSLSHLRHLFHAITYQTLIFLYCESAHQEFSCIASYYVHIMCIFLMIHIPHIIHIETNKGLISNFEVLQKNELGIKMLFPNKFSAVKKVSNTRHYPERTAIAVFKNLLFNLKKASNKCSLEKS